MTRGGSRYDVYELKNKCRTRYDKWKKKIYIYINDRFVHCLSDIVEKNTEYYENIHRALKRVNT